jgi:serine/threonine-protein kinase
MPLRIGETFAGYRILRLLGSGGMGEVYLVQHPRLPRQDALKVLRPDVSSDTSFRERFIREADLAAGLRHPHIVGIHDRGEHDGQLWIAMDYVDGTDAAQLIQQRYPAGMPAELAVPIITAVASALDYAHKKSLLHRDVKPANIIVADLDSDNPSVFLADFGIARPLEDTSGITTTNMTVGTVAYAAPEQLMAEQMDGRADEYALAATAYHLLSGVQLFPNSNPAVVISRHLNMTPPKLGDRRRDGASLDEVLQIALSKNPDDRFPSCSAFARALVDESAETGAASANATTQEAPQPPRSASTAPARSPTNPPNTGSRRAWVVVGGVAAIILLVGVVTLAWRP